MNNTFKYIHFLMLWFFLGMIAQVSAFMYFYAHADQLTNRYVTMSQGLWLMALPAGTLFYTIQFCLDVYDWIMSKNAHNQIEASVKARTQPSSSLIN